MSFLRFPWKSWISDETSTTDIAKKLFSTYDHTSFYCSDLILPCWTLPVIRAHYSVTLENLGKPLVLGLLGSTGSVSAGTEGRQRQARHWERKGKWNRNKWTFQKWRDTNKGSQMGYRNTSGKNFLWNCFTNQTSLVLSVLISKNIEQFRNSSIPMLK